MFCCFIFYRKCPQCLIAPLIQLVIQEIRKSCKKEPTAYGFNSTESAYEPLKLMQSVMAKTNEICLRYLDNSNLCSLPPPPTTPYCITSDCAVKNRRKGMEDRHVIVHDLNTMFSMQEVTPSSYYAIFDGHAGHNAAAYSAAHLHQYLAESKYFLSEPKQALHEAFTKTDELFSEKCRLENVSCGTTAVCALLRQKEKRLYVAWVGDSQAILVNRGEVLQCVHPHKPSRDDERLRIEEAGGYVSFWGIWRVQGQLAVSRAIGDTDYKPSVIADPDILEIQLDGNEDFLVLACDGLWDHLSEADVARTVYKMLYENCDTKVISERLVQLSKQEGSYDNISVIVVFLREPSKILESDWKLANRKQKMDATSFDNANTNPFALNGSDNNMLKTTSNTTSSTPSDDDQLLLNLTEAACNKQNCGNGDVATPSPDNDYPFVQTTEKSNGTKRNDFDEEDEDEDLGPETDVDAIDDVIVSPSILAAKALAEGIVNNNPPMIDASDFSRFDPFGDQINEKLELDLDVQKRQGSEFDGERSPREETPTPPADALNDGGLVDNVAESGDESDDEEWNYIKGEEADKENTDPTKSPIEVFTLGSQALIGEALEEEENDSMSQLNPDAAEFIPVSPTRSVSSPICRALIEDEVIAQSPKRPSNIDIQMPNKEEFETEVKSRPSDFNTFKNGHHENGDTNNESSPLKGMDQVFNGKSSVDGIVEFEPSPSKSPLSDEFYFGQNAAPFTPAKPLDQSEAAFSTQANYGDDTNLVDLTFESSPVSGDNIDFGQFKKANDDPMSMSFYQDKENVSFKEEARDEEAPVDLNKVHLLPDSFDDLEQNGLIPHEDTISDLPEHDPSKGWVEQKDEERIEVVEEELHAGDGLIAEVQTTDLDRNVEEEKAPVVTEAIIEAIPDLCRNLESLQVNEDKHETLETIAGDIGKNEELVFAPTELNESIPTPSTADIRSFSETIDLLSPIEPVVKEATLESASAKAETVNETKPKPITKQASTTRTSTSNTKVKPRASVAPMRAAPAPKPATARAPPASRPAPPRAPVASRTAPKPATFTARPAPKPRTTVGAAGAAPERKPLTNGAARSARPTAATSAKQAPAARATPSTTVKAAPTTSVRAAAPMTARTTLPTTTRAAPAPASTATSRLRTSPTKAAPARLTCSKPATITRNIPATSTTASARSSTVTKTTVSKARPATAPSPPKTASRVTAISRTTKTTAKPDVQANGTARVGLTKTRPTAPTAAAGTKKAIDTKITKITKTEEKIEKTIENGVASVVTEEIVINNLINEAHDIAPLIDNNQSIIDANAD